MTSRLPLSRLPKVLLAGIVSLALVGSAAFASPALSAEGSEEHHGHHHGAPEIDPNLAAAGIVLLIGGTLVLTGRRRPATN
jgi:hypothetical protein